MTAEPTVKQDRLTEGVHDPIYSATRAPVRIDADTLERSSVLYSAQTNGSATLADPLNSTAAPKTTLFVIGSSSASPIRFNTMGLRVRSVIHLQGNTAASAPFNDPEVAFHPSQPLGYNAPSWNLPGRWINQIKLSLNDVVLYESTPGYFCEEFSARLFRNHTFESLESKDSTLFTPCFDRNYTATTARTNAQVDPGVGVAPFAAIKPAIFDGVSGSYFSATYAAGPVSPVNIAGFTHSYNKWFESPQAVERARRWILPNSHQHIISKVISFSDLFPRMPEALFSNVKSIKIEIVWAQGTDILEHSSTTAATMADMSLIGTDIVSDNYHPSSAAYEELVKARDSGVSEKIAFVSSQVVNLTYNPGTDLIVPSLTGFDGVIVMQLAYGRANGQAAAAARTYNSFGQTLLFGNNAFATVGDIKLSADQVSVDALPISSVQMQFAGRQYPSSQIITSQTVNGAASFDYAPLYAEYLKFCGKFSRRDMTAAIPAWAFAKTCPIIALRGFSDATPHMNSQGGDLIIRMQGGYSSPVAIVVFRTVIAEIGSDGSVNVHKS